MSNTAGHKEVSIGHLPVFVITAMAAGDRPVVDNNYQLYIYFLKGMNGNQTIGRVVETCLKQEYEYGRSEGMSQ